MARESGAKKKTGTKKKSTSGSAKKKTTKAAPGKTGVKKTAKTKKAASEKRTSDKSPLYLLSILALLCVVVILVNNYYTRKKTAPVLEDKIAEKDSREEKKNILAERKETKNEKKEAIKAEKTEKREEPREMAVHGTPVDVFLVEFDERTEKMSLVPIKRKVVSASPIRGALNELLRGPDKSDEKRGLLTAIPGNLRLRDVSIVNGTAVLDFNDAIEENANGSILLMRVDQIVYTATQFKNIDSVVIKINGRRKSFLGSDGLSISGPITRRK